MPDLLTVLTLRELHTYCITFFADAVTGFNIIGHLLQLDLSKIFNTISSSTSPLTSHGIPTMSRHSRLEYCAFAQHCHSKVTNLLDNRVLTFFVIDNSELSLVMVSDKLHTSSRTLLLALLLASSSLPCRDKTIRIRSCLRSLSNES